LWLRDSLTSAKQDAVPTLSREIMSSPRNGTAVVEALNAARLHSTTATIQLTQSKGAVSMRECNEEERRRVSR
jgi:hypothetical protein